MAKTIVCADALTWLAKTDARGAVVTSLPDADEIGKTPEAWRSWFCDAVDLTLRVVDPAAPAIFYQTDRKADGQTYSKAQLVLAAASAAGARLLWHKIVLRRDVGATDLHRPGYTHLIAVSREGRPGKATPDVIERGTMIYPNAMGLAAASTAVRFAATAATTIIDPFCGRGTVPAVAAALGLEAIGVDIDPDQCEAARLLVLAARR